MHQSLCCCMMWYIEYLGGICAVQNALLLVNQRKTQNNCWGGRIAGYVGDVRGNKNKRKRQNGKTPGVQEGKKATSRT
jgi:hypothetical protein